MQSSFYGRQCWISSTFLFIKGIGTKKILDAINANHYSYRSFWMSLFDPNKDLMILAYLSIGVAFASASQDVAIDAYRIEIIENKFQAAMAASYQLGYRIAALTSGAGALYLAQFYSWQLTYQVMACFMFVGIVTTLVIAESPKQIAPIGKKEHWFTLFCC